jgi:hypothetical protein
MPEQFTAISLTIDPTDRLARVVAVDTKGALWLLWSGSLYASITAHPEHTWVQVLAELPPHP